MTRKPPWQVWVVTAMSLGTSIALYWIDHIYRQPLWFLPIFILLCASIVYGTYAGHRWAFVLNLLTVWIFPLETYKGIKQPLTGSVLTVLHVVSVALLVWAWQYYWNKSKGITE